MTLVSCVSKDGFDLVVLFLLSIRIKVIAWMRLVELLKVFNVVGIVGYPDAPAGGPQFVPRNTGFLLLLGASAILGIRV